MSIFDNFTKKAKEDEVLVNALKNKTGADVKNLRDLAPEKLEEIKELIKKAAGKVDVNAIAEKAGVSAEVVQKVLDKLM